MPSEPSQPGIATATRPLLSILLPTHNAAKTLSVTLSSLRAQTLRDFEVVAFDDCSNDETIEILEDLARAVSWLRVERTTENLGIGSVRNRLLDLARGSHIGFIDADDWVTRDFYANLVNRCQSEGLDFVRCDHVKVTEKRRVLTRAPFVSRNVTLPPWVGLGVTNRASLVDYPYSWAGVYSASFLRDRGIRFIDGAHSAEDRLFTWRIHLEGTAFQCTDEAGYMYRREVSPSLTQVGDERQTHFLKACEACLDYFDAHPEFRAFRPKLHRQILGLMELHHTKRERLTPEAWTIYLEGSQRILKRMGRNALDQALELAKPARIALIEALEKGRGTKDVRQGVRAPGRRLFGG